MQVDMELQKCIRSLLSAMHCINPHFIYLLTSHSTMGLVYMSTCCICGKMQKVKSSGADTEGRIAPKPPPDPNRQLSRAGSRPRSYQQLSHNAADPNSSLSSILVCTRLKSESLNDGIVILSVMVLICCLHVPILDHDF